MRYYIEHLPMTIPVGVQSEHNAEAIEFDVSDWLKRDGSLSFSAWITRPGETEAYQAANTTLRDGNLYWWPSSADTAIAGKGRVEILAVSNDRRMLSGWTSIDIRETSTDTTTDTPVAQLPWLDQALLASEEAKAAATSAAASADRAEIVAKREIARETAPAIVPAAAGEVVSITDSAERPLASLRIYGKTTQNGTPTPSAPVPLVNVGAGGSITVKACGKNLLKRTDLREGVQVSQPGDHPLIVDGYGWRKEVPVGTDTPILGMTNDLACLRPGVTYTLSFLAWCSGTGNVRVDCYPDTLPETGITLTNMPTRYTWTFSSDLLEMANARIRIYGANTGSDTWIVRVVDINLEVGSTATAFEAYKDGGSLTASTPNGLAGIPVSSGGDYTNASGQKWVCDEIDFGRGVYVRRIGAITIGASTGLGTYGSSGVFVSAIGQNAGNLLCNIASYANRSAIYNGTEYGVSDNLAYNQIVFSLEGYSTTEQYKALFASLEASGTPATVLYALATPVETPLSADELAAFRAMKTNKPNTTIYNDAGAVLHVDYIADTKLYIDKKIAAIAAASLNV